MRFCLLWMYFSGKLIFQLFYPFLYDPIKETRKFTATVPIMAGRDTRSSEFPTNTNNSKFTIFLQRMLAIMDDYWRLWAS